jgi:hypothetical protein
MARQQKKTVKIQAEAPPDPVIDEQLTNEKPEIIAPLFEDSEGINGIKLSRIVPNDGHLDTIDPSSTVDDIKYLFGGGRFRADAIDSHGRYLEGRTFKIAGAPKYPEPEPAQKTAPVASPPVTENKRPQGDHPQGSFMVELMRQNTELIKQMNENNMRTIEALSDALSDRRNGNDRPALDLTALIEPLRMGIAIGSGRGIDNDNKNPFLEMLGNALQPIIQAFVSKQPPTVPQSLPGGQQPGGDHQEIGDSPDTGEGGGEDGDD